MCTVLNKQRWEISQQENNVKFVDLLFLCTRLLFHLFFLFCLLKRGGYSQREITPYLNINILLNVIYQCKVKINSRHLELLKISTLKYFISLCLKYIVVLIFILVKSMFKVQTDANGRFTASRISNQFKLCIALNEQSFFFKLRN